MKLNIDDTFNKELPADPITDNYRRQVTKSCFSFVSPKAPKSAKIIHISDEMLDAIGLKEEDIDNDLFRSVFTGNATYAETKPYAMCYGGHQFGHWAGQLGDGRAINLFEVVHNQQRWALQLKGAGETPYSRTADGLAVLRSSIREHLCSEAMYALNVPTTRSLSLALSGDQVLRDIMYNGNQAYEPGAIVCRVAPSFIRFGNFQIFAAREDVISLKMLADYTIRHFFREIKEEGKDAYLAFFDSVVNKTIDMIVDWQRVGFVHGVMNTDNMSILGLTIDYGPYGWLEGFDPNWTPNTTDAQGRRYRFGHQPQIAMWNLAQLANALYPLIEDVSALETILKNGQKRFSQCLLNMNLSKLGLEESREGDEEIVQNLMRALQLIETDMIIFYRNLSAVSVKRNSMENFDLIKSAFYDNNVLNAEVENQWISWFDAYSERLTHESLDDRDRKVKMNQVNPKYVLRNYMAQLAIDEAEKGNYELIDELYNLLKRPYNEQPENEQWFARRPEWARHKVGCSMLSCSS